MPNQLAIISLLYQLNRISYRKISKISKNGFIYSKNIEVYITNALNQYIFNQLQNYVHVLQLFSAAEALTNALSKMKESNFVKSRVMQEKE